MCVLATAQTMACTSGVNIIEPRLEGGARTGHTIGVNVLAGDGLKAIEEGDVDVLDQ